MHPQPRGGENSPHWGVAVYIFSFPFLKTKICYAFYTYTPRVVLPIDSRVVCTPYHYLPLSIFRAVFALIIRNLYFNYWIYS